MARVVTLAELPQGAGQAGVARGSITAGETKWMDAEIVRLGAGATFHDTVPPGSDCYLFVTAGEVALTFAQTNRRLQKQATAVIQERSAFSLTNSTATDATVVRVLAPPANAQVQQLAGFTGEVEVRPRDGLRAVPIPEQKKLRFYIVGKEAAHSARGHAMIVEYEKDTVTAFHHHPNADSMFVLLEGDIQFVVDGKETVVRPGQACVFRAGDKHSLRCADGVTSAAFLEFHIPASYTTIKE